MLIDDLDTLPEMFKDGVRGIMILHRTKDGETGNAQRKAIKKISRDKEEWLKIISDFRYLQQNSYQGHRIYSSVNSRNMEKAIHEFKLRQLHHDYGNLHELNCFYTDIENRFFSCMMNPGCRETSYFLFDCDSIEEHIRMVVRIPSDLICADYGTYNGRHILTRPFNPTPANLEPKKDDLILIG